MFEKRKIILKFLKSLYITLDKIDLHGTSRFNIHYNCYSYSGNIVKSILLAVTSICGIDYSIFHLHVSKRAL